MILVMRFTTVFANCRGVRYCCCFLVNDISAKAENFSSCLPKDQGRLRRAIETFHSRPAAVTFQSPPCPPERLVSQVSAWNAWFSAGQDLETSRSQ